MDELQTLIDKWDLILSTFKEEHEIIDVSFKTWIKPLKIYKLDGNVLTLTFSSLEDDASTDERSIVYIEKRYLKFLEVTVCEVMNKEYQVIIMSCKCNCHLSCTIGNLDIFVKKTISSVSFSLSIIRKSPF